jgi:predicted HTH domain antitoxin
MKTTSISYKIPDYLLTTLSLNSTEFSKQSRLFTALQLFKDNKLSSGQAANIAGMDKYSFWMELGKHGIPLINYEPSDLLDELKHFNK